MGRNKTILIICLTALIFGFIISAVFFYSSPRPAGSKDRNSFFVDAELASSMTQGAEKCLNDKKNEKIGGGIVNHHLLASGLVSDFFCRVSDKKINRVILLSPNHFGLGSGWLVTGANDWQAAAGAIMTDRIGAEKLAEEKIALIDDRVFAQEHGIGNLMPLVKAYFPNAKVLPIIVKENIPLNRQEELVSALLKIADDETIIIASLDFSHDLSLAEAQVRDEETLKILTDLDYGRIGELNQLGQAANVDSPAVLNIFLRLMFGRDCKNFEQIGHSNSAIISGQPQLASTTSYFTAVYLR